MRRLLTLTATDLRKRVRDKSVLIFALVVPLALMGVFNLVFGQEQGQDLGPVTVAVAAPEDDALAGAVDELLSGLDDDVLAVTVSRVPAADVPAAVEDGVADLGVVVPEGFGPAIMTGQGATLAITRGESTLESSVVVSMLDGLLTRLHSGTVAAQAARGAGLAPEELQAVADEATNGGPALTLAPGQAAAEQLGPAASLVAGQTGLFLLFTVSFGVLGLIEERETGTLARLQSMPMPRWYVVVSKALVGVVMGVVATAVLLTAGGLMFGVGFGSPAVVAVLIVGAVVAATSLMFLVARVARTAEQAGVAASILAFTLGIAGGAFMPVSASGAMSTLLDLNPVAAFMRGLGITAGGGGLADVGVPLLTMAGFAVVMVLLSHLVPDRGVTA